MWFCDWLTGRLPFRAAHEVNGGYVRVIDADGRVERTTVRRFPVRGSFESKMMVKSIGDDLHFDGNPTKFLQGHNLYGANDLSTMGFVLGWEFAMALEIMPDPADVQRWWQNDLRLTRIDVTRMYRPEWAQPGWVAKWLAIAGTFIHGGHQRVTNASQYDTGTLYVGQRSRRICLTMYDKAAELRKHPPRIPAEAGGDEAVAQLVAYAADTLRVELRLRGLELKDRGLTKLSAWTPAKGDEIMDERIGRLQIPDDVRMTEDELADAPRKLREVYALWRAGEDLRQLYGRTQFYTHRKALLAYGIDIAHVQPHVVVSKHEYAMGRPLKDYLMGGGLDPPTSAIERGELGVREA